MPDGALTKHWKPSDGIAVNPSCAVNAACRCGHHRSAVLSLILTGSGQLWPRLLVHSMGLDAEPAEPLPEGVLGSIARDSELPQLDQLRSGGLGCADRLLFCAKEATYKAWFPLTHRWLGFDQAEIDIRADGSFVSYLLIRPTPIPFISGRWIIRDGFLVAATAVGEMPS